MIDEVNIDDELPGEGPIIFLERNQLHSGVPCKVRMVNGSVDHIVYLVFCSEHGGELLWTDVKDIASRQVTKIRSTIIPAAGY
jgi:hypothetical protein